MRCLDLGLFQESKQPGLHLGTQEPSTNLTKVAVLHYGDQDALLLPAALPDAISSRLGLFHKKTPPAIVQNRPPDGTTPRGKR